MQFWIAAKTRKRLTSHWNRREQICHELLFATSSRSGQSGVLAPKHAAAIAQRRVEQGASVAVVFGNEKTGLTAEELLRIPHGIRIPLAAAQPSVNLAQACQIIAYEFFCAALDAREKEQTSRAEV
jgi:tRNA C32,U32 (ribose-2'-O)-methylase TrmJ